MRVPMINLAGLRKSSDGPQGGRRLDRTIFATESARRRLPRQERERQIVDEAIRFFAEVGFDGQTRVLAARLGITQPLLYRYFPDKEALIERVYAEVFEGGWNPDWDGLLRDRRLALGDRIVAFYRGYCRANFSYERVRLFMYAGLKDQSFARRYMAFVRTHLFEPLAAEIRHEAGLPEAPASLLEIECVAGLHGGIGYGGLRRWVFQDDVPEDAAPTIALQVDAFLSGAVAAFRKDKGN